MGRETTRTSDRVRPTRRTRLFLLAVFAALLAIAPAAAQTGTALVERVIDGDTIRVRMAGAPSTARLTGVDTPETKRPTLGVQPFGPEASAYTTARLTGATVRLDLDPAGAASDTCGRPLRYVMLGGENFNVTLIREGFATASRRFPLLPEARVSRNRSPGAAGAARAMGQLMQSGGGGSGGREQQFEPATYVSLFTRPTAPGWVVRAKRDTCIATSTGENRHDRCFHPLAR